MCLQTSSVDPACLIVLKASAISASATVLFSFYQRASGTQITLATKATQFYQSWS